MKNIIPLILAIVFIGGIIYFAIRSDKKSNDAQSDIVLSQDVLNRKKGEAWVNGNPQAVTVLVEYSDFQCPACASWSILVNQAIEKYNQDLRFEYRHFPLQSIHKRAFAAAKAAEAAGRQGKFWPMSELLFSNQASWSESLGFEAIIKKYAADLKIDVDQFIEDYYQKLTSDLVQADIKKGNQLNLNSTPTFFLDNKKIQPQSPDDFFRLIAEAIDSNR